MRTQPTPSQKDEADVNIHQQKYNRRDYVGLDDRWLKKTVRNHEDILQLNKENKGELVMTTVCLDC